MKIEFDKSEISVGALLGCFSIPSNAEYLITEIGIATHFYKNLAVDKNLLKPYQIDAYDSNRIHTLFSMFSNPNQKQFIANHIPSAKLLVSNAEEITKNWEFICEFICSQFNGDLITLNIKFNIIKDDLDITFVSASSKVMNEDEMRSFPLILSLLTPS